MSRYWIRQTEILAGGKRFHSDELDIDFEVPFDNDEEPDVASVTIYNLSENSINAMWKEISLCRSWRSPRRIMKR